MVDSNEVLMYENGRLYGYDNGYGDAVEEFIRKLEIMKSKVRDNGCKMSESRLPHNYYKAISVRKTVNIINELIHEYKELQ